MGAAAAGGAAECGAAGAGSTGFWTDGWICRRGDGTGRGCRRTVRRRGARRAGRRRGWSTCRRVGVDQSLGYSTRTGIGVGGSAPRRSADGIIEPSSTTSEAPAIATAAAPPSSHGPAGGADATTVAPSPVMTNPE